jgi:hypothetical protein
MSGSSGGGGGGGGGGTPDQIDCDKIYISTQLSSPQPKVVEKLAEGTELRIELRDMNGTSVLVALLETDLAGGLAAPETAKLRNCIDQGHQYGATVVSINGGQVRVRIHPL